MSIGPNATPTGGTGRESDPREIEQLRLRLDALVASMTDDDRPAPFAELEAAAATLFDGELPTSEMAAAAVDDLRRAGAALTRVLELHPGVGGRQVASGLLDLFDIESPEWADPRPLYAYTGLTIATSIVLAEPDVPDRADLAMQVAFGLDPVSELFRQVTFGIFGSLRDLHKVGISLPVRLTPFEELYRRTCLGGIGNALAAFGRAARQTPRRVNGPVIVSVQPRRGCAGTAVQVSGLGFGGQQPPGVRLTFASYAGGARPEATVAPADWSDTLLHTTAPADVGDGSVTLIGWPSGTTGAGPSQSVSAAADTLAGEIESCLGTVATRAVYGLRVLAAGLVDPHVQPTFDTRFIGGPPRIRTFTGNGATRVLLRPYGPLEVAWSTDNADTVTIQAAGPTELPGITGALPTTGSRAFSSVSATAPWTGRYTLTAANPCGQITRSIDIVMADRLALVLSGGGSKGAFEVGAVRCLYTVFGVDPDLICGTSVGALNAAKLAEGRLALADLEAMWLAMTDASDMYRANGWVTSIVNNLATLGLQYMFRIDFADLLGVRLENQDWLSPDAQVAVSSIKNMIGTVSGAGTLFTIFDILESGARAGMAIAKIINTLDNLLNKAPALFVADPVRTKIDALVDPTAVEASGIELRIAMVNLADGRTRYVDQRGRFVDNGELVPLRDALQASASIPIAYPPMTLPGGRYVDGGVRENVPIRIADEASASSVIAILASPVSMSPADFSTAVLPAIAARSAEALYDEVLQADIAPRGGFRAPLTIIAPDVEPYSLFTVDPGLIRIAMDYGYMRAFDEMHANVSVRGALRDLSTRIFRTRKLVWGPLEHRSEGALMKQEIAGFKTVGITRAPSADSLRDVRAKKIEIRSLALQRQNLAHTARANPADITAVWQEWEAHTWLTTILSPWSATYAHAGPPLPAVTPPGPLPPP